MSGMKKPQSQPAIQPCSSPAAGAPATNLIRSRGCAKRGQKTRNGANKPYQGGMTPHARGCHRNLATNSLSSGTAAPPMAGSCLEPAARRLNAFDITNGTCVARIIGSRGSNRYNLSACLGIGSWARQKKRPRSQSTCKPLFSWPCRLDIASKARRGHTLRTACIHHARYTRYTKSAAAA